MSIVSLVLKSVRRPDADARPTRRRLLCLVLSAQVRPIKSLQKKVGEKLAVKVAEFRPRKWKRSCRKVVVKVAEFRPRKWKRSCRKVAVKVAKFRPRKWKSSRNSC